MVRCVIACAMWTKMCTHLLGGGNSFLSIFLFNAFLPIRGRMLPRCYRTAGVSSLEFLPRRHIFHSLRLIALPRVGGKLPQRKRVCVYAPIFVSFHSIERTDEVALRASEESVCHKRTPYQLQLNNRFRNTIKLNLIRWSQWSCYCLPVEL